MHCFEICDMDKDGAIDKDDMKNWLVKYLNSRPEKKEHILKLHSKKTLMMQARA